MNNENDDFKQIDRKVVTEATMLDLELDMCHDPSEYNELQEYYRRLLYKYDLSEKPFVEDASESDYHEYTEEDDIAVIICENGKYGVQESWRFHKLDPIYDSIEQLDHSNLFKVSYNGQFGVIDLNSSGKEVIPFEYDSIDVNWGDRFCAIVEKKEDYHHIITRIGNRFGFYDTEFNVAPRFEQYKIGRSLSFIRFMLNGKWGFIDKNGEWTDKIEEARAYIRNPMYYIR